MKRILTHLWMLSVTLGGMAEVNVGGKVIEKPDDEPLAGATVIVRGADGKIKKFASTKSDGGFTMSLPDDVVTGFRLEVSMMGFGKRSLALDSLSFPVTVYLEPATTMLKEVTVKADRIREQGDTITYSVSGFAQEQDRSIGDVLKRMPGINVEKSGKIQYQGEDINKFYIEGSDLLGGKYGIATNGISHEDVGAVEVMENHQPMQVLAGISFSDKAAINLKLKNKAKATWSFHGDAAGGYSSQPEGALWDGELFAMAAMPDFQNITTIKTNNTGEDLTSHTTDFFASRRGTDLSRSISVSLPGVPDLSRKRTLFNRSVLVSTNNLYKAGRGEFRAQMDYSFNRVMATAANVTTYFLDGGDRIVAEDRSGVDRSHSLSGKFIYELNQRRTFINNTLQTEMDWDNVSLGMTGTLPNSQSASLPDYFVRNNFKMIRRFKSNQLVTILSTNEWESEPETLRVKINGGGLRQHIGNHAFTTNESVSYAFIIKGVTVSLEGGLRGYLRTMKSDLSGSGLPALPNLDGTHDFHNLIHTNSLTLYATPKFEYWVKRVNLTLDAPLKFSHYAFDNTIANRDEIYFSPSLSLNWKPDNKLEFTLRGGSNRSPMELGMIQPNPVLTDYRSLRSGVDDFYNLTSQRVSGRVAYKHTRYGIFGNASVMQSWSNRPYTMIQQLYGDYVSYAYSSAKSDSRMLMASGNVGKTLDFMRGSLNLHGSFSRQDSRMISLYDGVAANTGNGGVNSVNTGWSAGAKISGTPAGWLSFDYSVGVSAARLTMNGIKSSWLGSMENELLLNVMPHKKWEWHICGEHYRNELTEGHYKTVVLLDTRLIYKLTKRVEFSGCLTNVLNHKSYNYTTFNQLTSFESRRQLRGREVLISVSLRK